MWIVILRDDYVSYGPFDTSEEASEFATYLNEEVDPSIVLKLRSPMQELLSWRRAVKEGTV